MAKVSSAAMRRHKIVFASDRLGAAYARWVKGIILAAPGRGRSADDRATGIDDDTALPSAIAERQTNTTLVRCGPFLSHLVHAAASQLGHHFLGREAKMRGDEACIDGNLTIDAHDSRAILLNAHFPALASPQAALGLLRPTGLDALSHSSRLARQRSQRNRALAPNVATLVHGPGVSASRVSSEQSSLIEERHPSI